MPAFDTSRRLQPGRPWAASHLGKPLASLLLAVAASLILVSRIEPAGVAPLRSWIVDQVAPATSFTWAVLAPVRRGLSAIRSDSATAGPVRLTLDAARIAALDMRIQDLERENRDLKSLAHYARSIKPALVAARVVLSSSTPLAQSIVVDAGWNQGVKGGMPVVSGDGLMGRVIHVHSNHSSVMLLSDRLSRVPVSIGTKQAHAVLAGAGTDLPKLEFMEAGSQIGAGDLVTTSGAGGVYPRGLAVGVVVSDAAGVRVDLIAGRTDPLAIGILLSEAAATDPHDADPPKSAARLGPRSEVK